MAMACACPAAVSALASSSTGCISSVSQGRRGAAAGASTARGLVVKCAQENDGNREARSVSRREVFSLATLSVLLLSTDKAQAKDIPLFGIRKQFEKAEKAVEKGVKALAKEGEKELEAVEKSVQAAVSDIEAEASSVSGFTPVFQAAGVAGAELVAVLVAGSVVNGLVSVPSKDKK